MSYILQALKKSELERERLATPAETESRLESPLSVSTQNTPKSGLINELMERFKQASLMTYSLVIMIMVLALSSYALVNMKKHNAIDQGVNIHAEPDHLPDNRLNPKVEEGISQRVPVKQISVVPVLAAKPPQEIGGKTQVNSKEDAGPKELLVKNIDPINASVEVNPSNKSIEVLRIEQAGDAELAMIPNISITSHIYSSQAKRRSIVVNDERLVEGDFVFPRVQIQEITHKGMILKVNDSLLAVSRSRGWNQ